MASGPKVADTGGRLLPTAGAGIGAGLGATPGAAAATLAPEATAAKTSPFVTLPPLPDPCVTETPVSAIIFAAAGIAIPEADPDAGA